ncbi:MAG: AIR synthase [Clostridiales bacterium]|nr:AIR synthase [Clostridiales bacterium]
MKKGKLDSELLKELVFNNISFRRPEVTARPGIGEDCAVVDFGEYECVLSTDPITGAVNEIGRLAIHISCNDIASNGVEPLGILLSCMLPVGTTKEDIDQIMKQAASEASKIGVEIIGGHTEITDTVNKPVIVSTAIGRGLKGSSQSARNMKPGDYILMTKQAGMEGTGIIVSDHLDRVKHILTPDEVQEALKMLDQVSVVKEGLIAGEIGTSGMHDITEGGVLGSVWEMCEVSDTGAEIWKEKIPVSEVTKKICEHFNIDWLRLISSGCMMIVVSPDKKDLIINRIQESGISISCIGIVRDKSFGRMLVDGDKKTEIRPPDSDELYKVI